MPPPLGGSRAPVERGRRGQYERVEGNNVHRLYDNREHLNQREGRSASQCQRAVVPVAAGVRALRLGAVARVLTRRGSAAPSTGPNTSWTWSASAEGAYPSGYNMSYLNENAAFIQGGSYGDVEGSIGPFVAKVDPKTLKPVWYTQLREHRGDRRMGLPRARWRSMNDGYIYVVSGYRIYKVDPANGTVVDDPQAADDGATCATTSPTRRRPMTRP